MSFNPANFEGRFALQTTLPPGGYVVLAVYSLVLLALLVTSRRDFAQLKSIRNLLIFAGALISAPVLARVLLLEQPFGPDVALLGALPLLVAATWLGPGPSLLVGLLSGLARAGWDGARLIQPLEVALWAGVMGLLLQQRYRDRVGGLLRQPLPVGVLSALIVAWPLTLLGVGGSDPGPFVARLEVSLTHLLSILLAVVAEALAAGGILQLLLWRVPTWRTVDEAKLISPPWTRRLSARILFIVTPLIVLVIIILVGGVALAAYPVATNLVIDQMARDAQTVNNEVPFFVQVGRSLIRDLATDERLLGDDGDLRQARLNAGLRTVPYFQQLVYVDAQGEPTNAYPESGALGDALAPEEESLVTLALRSGVPAESGVYAGQDGAVLFMTFASPVTDPATGESVGVLLGRTSLSDNPLMQPVVDVLRGGLVNAGEGLLIDEDSTILLYPAQPERQLETLQLASADEIRAGTGGGRVFREMNPDGTQKLVYFRPISGHSEWSVVLTVPNQVVLALAAQIAWPTLIILLVMAIFGLAATVVVSTRFAQPLETLAQAADRIAAGQLDDPVGVAGEDEVGRLGLAFEDMRHGLKARRDEQETLLNVSYAVSASLDLLRSLPPIISTALDATGALGVRIALRRDGGTLQTYAAGDGAAGMAPMDEELVEHADSQGALVVSRIERARETLKSSARVPHIKALVALPIRSETVFLGILWLAYEEERDFEVSELIFLQNLASQASFAVANARLFEEAEGGRRQLSAILSSTTDAVLVVDDKGCLMLTNPAAEEIFGVEAQQAHGRRVDEVIDHPQLVQLLADLNGGVASIELNHDGNHTLLANASPIQGTDGKSRGRVVLLSDITYLKELDELKSAFVSAVSHDLRAPLTFMSGYITMLPMVGDLNEKQHEFTDKLKAGVSQMTDLIEKLLNLGRIESGVPLNLEVCDVGALLTETHELFADHAREKSIRFELNLPGDLPHLLADSTLYRQAVVNLVENAVKYTPDGGKVTVSAGVRGDAFTVSVADTGPGISQEVQQQLFQPFFRVRDRKTSTIKGSGLGLAIVKGTADRHDGRVRIDSTPGEGSTFHLEMPLLQPQPQPEPQPEPE